MASEGENKYTLEDLEEKIHCKLVEKCKKDACIDKFLMQLSHIMDRDEIDRRQPAMFDRHQLGLTKVQNQEKLNEINLELGRNLHCLLPHIYGPSTKLGDLDSKSIRNRWKVLWESIGKEPNRFRSDMLQFLAVHLNELESVGVKGLASLKQQSETQVCEELGAILRESKAPFACGGSIPIVSTTENSSSQSSSSSAVHISWTRWKGNNKPVNNKLVLPLDGSQNSCPEDLQQLVQDCSPATFGRGDEDVLDLGYRCAGKMNEDDFKTTFHLSQFDILDQIERTLLLEGESKGKESPKIKAKLYKLNVYSGPSGLFKAHVDTPRSDIQIGSLVVCLPSSFKGGNLLVRHDRRNVDFDWASQSASTIQWAAFFSDCEHEIQTVYEGNRITLTYNLYGREGVKQKTPKAPINFKSSPLNKFMRSAWNLSGFFTDGGVIGAYFTHAYPHTTGLPWAIEDGEKVYTLKGSDKVFYSVLMGLGAQVRILPVPEMDGTYHTNHEWPLLRREEYCQDHTAIETMEKYLKDRSEPKLSYSELFEDQFERWDNVDIRWNIHLLNRHVEELKTVKYYQRRRTNDCHGLLYNSDYEEGLTGAHVGNYLHYYSRENNEAWDGKEPETVQEAWPYDFLRGITWINKPLHKKKALSYMVYGNETTRKTRYSACAILAVIPPWSQRSQNLGSGWEEGLWTEETENDDIEDETEDDGMDEDDYDDDDEEDDYDDYESEKDTDSSDCEYY